MRISEAGLQIIKEFEGLRLEAYRDSVGVPTIGYGHTHNVKMGDVITVETANRFLHEDASNAENCVTRSFKEIELTQGQYDALVSFTFNLGCGALHKSTLRRKLLHGDAHGAANEFHKWCHAGHHVLAGLVKRRKEEQDLFLS